MDNAGIPLDTEAKQLTVDGEPVKLTAKEYKILELLCEPGRRILGRKIYEQVWKDIPLFTIPAGFRLSSACSTVFSKYPLTRSLFYRQLIFIILIVFVFLLVFMLEESPPLHSSVLENIIIYWYIGEQ